MSIHVAYQEHLLERISQVRKAGVNTPEYQELYRKGMHEAEQNSRQLSAILDRLPVDQRKAIMLVMLQETKSLFLKLMAEAAFALHLPAMKEAAVAQNDDAFEAVKRSMLALVNI